MCFKYAIDPEANLAVITVVGNYDVPALVGTMKSLTADSLFNQKTKILIDKSQVTGLPTIVEAHNLAEVQGSNFKGHRIVVIAPETCLFGMNRMISTLSEMNGCPSAVVKSISEATCYLQ